MQDNSLTSPTAYREWEVLGLHNSSRCNQILAEPAQSRLLSPASTEWSEGSLRNLLPQRGKGCPPSDLHWTGNNKTLHTKHQGWGCWHCPVAALAGGGDDDALGCTCSTPRTAWAWGRAGQVPTHFLGMPPGCSHLALLCLQKKSGIFKIADALPFDIQSLLFVSPPVWGSSHRKSHWNRGTVVVWHEVLSDDTRLLLSPKLTVA